MYSIISVYSQNGSSCMLTFTWNADYWNVLVCCAPNCHISHLSTVGICFRRSFKLWTQRQRNFDLTDINCWYCKTDRAEQTFENYSRGHHQHTCTLQIQMTNILLFKKCKWRIMLKNNVCALNCFILLVSLSKCTFQLALFNVITEIFQKWAT